MVDRLSTPLDCANQPLLNARAGANSQVVARAYSSLVGDGVATSIAVTHNFGTKAVVVQVITESTGVDLAVTSITRAANTVTVVFGSAPATNAARITCVAYVPGD